MLVFWKEKLVFFAVPKTGTSALEAALAPRADIVIRNPPILKHVPFYRYNRFLRPLFEVVGAEEFDKMAVIREPISWLGSWYKYRARADLDGTPNSTKDVSFDDFVDGYAKGQRPKFADVGSQYKFLTRPNGDCAMTHLFQYEQMDKARAFLSERLGVDVSLDRKNVSPARSFALSDDKEAKLRRKCPEEFALWESAHIADG